MMYTDNLSVMPPSQVNKANCFVSIYSIPPAVDRAHHFLYDLKEQLTQNPTPAITLG